MLAVAVLGACSGAGDPAPGSDAPPVDPRDPDIVVSVYTTGFEGNTGARVLDFKMPADGTVS